MENKLKVTSRETLCLKPNPIIPPPSSNAEAPKKATIASCRGDSQRSLLTVRENLKLLAQDWSGILDRAWKGVSLHAARSDFTTTIRQVALAEYYLCQRYELIGLDCLWNASEYEQI